MDAIGGIFSNILSSVLGWFNGVLDPNEVYVLPILICVGVGILFLTSTKPQKFNLPVLSYALWAIAAGMLAALLNFTAVDSTLIGLTVATVFAVVLSSEKWQERKMLFGFIWGVLSFLLILSLFSVSSLNPEGGYMPSAFNAIRDMGLNLWSNIKWGV